MPTEFVADSYPEHREPVDTILFVDDEPLLRHFGYTVLTRKGYRVILAVDGEDALEKYQRFAAQIGLVVTDLTMPRLNGIETFQQLRRINPDVRVVFTSGYSDATLEPGLGIMGFLPKPYRPSELLDVVKKALAANRFVA